MAPLKYNLLNIIYEAIFDLAPVNSPLLVASLLVLKAFSCDSIWLADTSLSFRPFGAKVCPPKFMRGPSP